MSARSWGRLSASRLEFVAAGVLLYAGGQALSAWRWRMLLEPVALSVPYRRMVSFYFIGMFFNLFLPTIVGGDAVKALLLARETGAAGARDDVGVHGAQPRLARAAGHRERGRVVGAAGHARSIFR